tara:strand:- start:35 stop:277 length:243 start_codon:yes stop_codon:yes gene_type:complete
MITLNEVNLIISETFKISAQDIKGDLGPENIQEWDSLGQMTLVSAIEEQLQIELEVEEIFSILCIDDIYRVLEDRNLLEN